MSTAREISGTSTEWDGRKNPLSYKATWQVSDSPSLEAAFSMLTSTVEKKKFKMPLQSITLAEEVGCGVYRFDVRYKREAEEGEKAGTQKSPIEVFNCNVVSVHVNVAVAAQQIVVNPKVKGYDTLEKDIGKTIGYQLEGEPTGCDVLVPRIVQTYTFSIRDEEFTTEMKRCYARLTGTVNKDKFRGYNAGWCLLMGATATLRYEEGVKWQDVTLKVAIAGMEGNEIEMSEEIKLKKKPWEYVWKVMTQADDATQIKKNTILAGVSSKIYEEKNWTGLGIPTN